jgi:hypothetical protein
MSFENNDDKIANLVEVIRSIMGALDDQQKVNLELLRLNLNTSKSVSNVWEFILNQPGMGTPDERKQLLELIEQAKANSKFTEERLAQVQSTLPLLPRLPPSWPPRQGI